MRYLRAGGAALLVTTALVSGCAVARRSAPHTAQHPVHRVHSAVDLTAPQATDRQSAPAVTHRPAHRNHCAHNRAARLVRVSIEAQHAWLCARHRTVLSTAVTTGATERSGHATPRGRFRIEGLDRDSVLYPADGGAYPVQFWIPFDAPLYGFHDASWQKMPFGSPHYVTRGSHGCVHMTLPAIRFLYHWARIGTRVVIA